MRRLRGVLRQQTAFWLASMMLIYVPDIPLGGTALIPTINYPEVAILGVGRISEELALVQGQVLARSVMTLSLTIDHRIVDGTPRRRRPVSGYRLELAGTSAAAVLFFERRQIAAWVATAAGRTLLALLILGTAG